MMQKLGLLSLDRTHLASGGIRTMTKNLLKPRLIGVSVAALVLFGTAGCGGGGAAGSTGTGSTGTGSTGTGSTGTGSTGTGSTGTGSTGSGAMRVNVTDYFDQPVAGAEVVWLRWPLEIKIISDAEGNAKFDSVPSGLANVCVNHLVRGYAGCNSVTIPADSNVELARQVLPARWQPPIAAVVEAIVDPNGVSPDGRTLDIKIRVAVTQAPSVGTWFGADRNYPLSTTDCVAREGQDLVDFGARCIRGPAGTDTSYTFDGLIGRPVPITISQPVQPATVGLLLDQSAPVWDYEEKLVESRLFAAKIFADEVLPDIDLLLAGFAGDDPDGANSSRLPDKPVTFLPAQNPGLFLSRPEIFEQFDGLAALSGGVAPLYAAIVSSIDFVADRATPGTRRVLVVMANGRDDSCGTSQQCRAMRGEIAARARDRDVELILLSPDRVYRNSSPTEDAISALAVDAAVPWAVGSGRSFHEAFDLVQQLVGDSVRVEDVRVRLTSEAPGAFQTGAVVAGDLVGANPNNCPWDCYLYALPFSVLVP